MTCTNTLSLTANITGCEIPGNSRVAHCAEAQNWNLSRPARPAVVGGRPVSDVSDVNDVNACSLPNVAVEIEIVNTVFSLWKIFKSLIHLRTTF